MNFFSSAVFVSLVLFSSLCVSETSIVQSPNDDRFYQYLTLDNGLQVILISDPDTDKAAASMDVFVGSSSNPEGWEGLAHFLEHMLFLGTEKYPDAGEYQAFINQHGGNHNAYTSSDHTNYFFDIDSRQLQGSLDRFSQFFIAPLFSQQYVEREKNAVHSEYQAKIKDDSRRIYAAHRMGLNPQSPYSRFSVGSLETLADKPGKTAREELLEFYQRHYSANLMRLVVLGKEELPILQKWVETNFSAIKNNQFPRPDFDARFILDKQLPQRIDIVPLKELRSLGLSFQMPPVEALYLSKPATYLGHLLGHEGKGSLLSLLKSKGWAEALSAGSEMSNARQSMFGISINLTKAGLGHIDEITDHVFQYVRLIRESGIESWIFAEQQQMSELQFQFQEERSASSTVTRLSNAMQYYPIMDVLRGNQIMSDFKPEIMHQFLEYLAPDKLTMTVVAPELSVSQMEEKYSVPYQRSPIGEELITGWKQSAVDPELQLIQPNPFIPNQVSIKKNAESAKTPVEINKTAGFSLWHQQDDSFSVPKATLYFSVRSPLANDTATHSVLTKLFVLTLNEQLNEYAYPALLAGLGYTIYPHVRGFSVRVSGYDQKQALLLETIVNAIHQPEFLEDRFSILKERLLRELNNDKLKRPYAQTHSELSRLMMTPQWSPKEQLKVLSPLNMSDLQKFIPELMSKLQVLVLSHGNVDSVDSQKRANIIQQTLLSKNNPVVVPRAGVVTLPDNGFYGREITIDHPDSALSFYYQAHDAKPETLATIALLEQVISAPFYTQLRTEQQLGYIVHAGSMPMLEFPGIVFIVQSPVASAGMVEQRIETFIGSFADTLSSMSADELEGHKQGLINKLLEEDKNLQARSNRYWQELDRKNSYFDYHKQIADKVAEITLEDLSVYYQNLFIKQSRRMLVFSTGTKNGGKGLPANMDLIQEPSEFKQKQSIVKLETWPPVSTNDSGTAAKSH